MFDVLLIIRFLFLILATGMIVGMAWILWPYLIGAPWIPTPLDTVHRMLTIAQVEPSDHVVDLGSGDGRILLTAATAFGATATGIEADPFRVIWSRLRIRRQGLKQKVRVIWGNMFTQNLVEATVVTIFQYSEVNNRLAKKLRSELQPGTRVVSYAFPVSGWTPVKTSKEPELYLYTV